MEVQDSIVPTAVILTGGFGAFTGNLVLNLGQGGGMSLGYAVLPPAAHHRTVYPNAAAITGNVLFRRVELPDRSLPFTDPPEWAFYNAEND